MRKNNKLKFLWNRVIFVFFSSGFVLIGSLHAHEATISEHNKWLRRVSHGTGKHRAQHTNPPK